ncbi:DUF2207 domain-containing protein [Luteimonas sp. A501]
MNRLATLAGAWLLAVSVLLAPAAAAAKERVLAYDSVVEVQADGSLDVTEHIRVRAEGSRIRRGITRDFPTRYKDRRGNNVVVAFEVESVERDGHKEPWFTERVANGVRVNTGNDDLLQVPAEYTYTLRYRTDRQLGFFEDHDELYWNAIGQGWDFPIETGTVEVRLPEPVAMADLAVEGYSGARGARGQDFEAVIAAPGVARWTLTRPLAPREGLTTVLSFPKGIVAPPSSTRHAFWLLRDNLSILIALAGLAGLLLFCVRRWRKVGRDPAPGVVIARYEPPRGESPAALRYMTRRNHDARGFSADLLACAVQGAVGIHRDEGMLGDKWKLERSDDGAPGIDNPDQRGLLEALLPTPGATLTLDKKNATRIQRAMQAHRKGFDDRFQPAMFTHNAGSIGIAMAILFTTCALAMVAMVFTDGGGLPWVFLPLGLMLATTIAFALVIGAPTAAGRELLDEIEGFRRYLGVAEQDDIARVQAPEAAGGDAPEPALDAGRFERLLPYAVALDVEDAWTKKFTVAVGSAAAAAATAAITWYHGASLGNIGNLTSAVGGALSSQIASSSTPPGSSSGAGGGGFSGGGGGGGGGGGR